MEQKRQLSLLAGISEWPQLASGNTFMHREQVATQ